MDLSKILSISGKHGLFQVVSQLKNAVLVESLIDKKRFPAFAHEKISSLKEISVFTTGEDKPLKDILKALYDKFEGKAAINTKSDDKSLKAFFLEVVPDYDQDRVYSSDIKKIINWYNMLAENNLLDFTEPTEETKEEATGVETTEKEVIAKPVRKKKTGVANEPREQHVKVTTQKKTRKKV
jgi:hypothetical protein